MKTQFFALSALALALVGCGGSGSVADAPVLPESRGADSSVLAALNTGEASAQEALNRIKASNAILLETADWLSTTRAVYTKTVGTVTATVTVTATSKTKSSFTIVLNGTVAQTTYTNFLWCNGTIEVATDKATKKAGSHVIATWYELKNGGTSTTRATGDLWFYTDGTAQGSLTGSDGTLTTVAKDASAVWTFMVYTDSTKAKKLAEGTVNADKSGSAKLYCTTDGKVQAQVSWTAAQTGQVCVFATACSSEKSCRAFP